MVAKNKNRHDMKNNNKHDTAIDMAVVILIDKAQKAICFAVKILSAW